MAQEISINKPVKTLIGLKLLILFILSFGLRSAFGASLEGKIRDKESGLPIPGVKIILSGVAKISIFSDQNGYYRIDRLPTGNLTLILTSPFYKGVTKTLEINDEKKLYHLDFLLEISQKQLQEIIVRSRANPRSDRQARIQEQKSVPSIDIASGNLIEHSQSISAGDVIQLIPGASITYTKTGTADKAIIRGMESKYTYTLINGYKIPSPDDKSRYISLDVFPASLLQSVQVYKTLTADMEGDGIGGATNLVLREVPENPLELNFSTGYNTIFFNQGYRTFNSRVVENQSPYERYGSNYYATGNDFTRDNLYFHNIKPLPDINASLIYGRKFLKDKLYGIASFDYKDIKTGSNGYYLPLNGQPNLNNVPSFSDFKNQIYYNDKRAFTLSSEISYKPDSLNRFRISYLYLNQKDIETRSTIDTSLTLGRSMVGTGRIYLSDRSRVHQQELHNLNLNGTHFLGKWELDWAGIYGIAKGRYPDWSELTANTGNLISPEGSIVMTPLLLAPLSRTWLSNRENDEDGYLDIHYKPSNIPKWSLSLGGLIRHKTRNNFYNNYDFSPQINEPFTNIYNAVWQNNNGPKNPLGNVNNPNTYTAFENIEAGYLSFRLSAGKSDFTTGIRFENTSQKVVSDLDPTVSYGKEISIQYYDWLPNFHWKYSLNQHEQFKVEYYKAISRPALYDITFESISYEDFKVAGNPFLIRTKADNFDINYSLSKETGDRLKIGLFYKHIKDAYEKTLINGQDELYPLGQNGLTYTPAGVLTEQLKNTGDASNYGAEIAYDLNWKNFGMALNFTFTSSNIIRMKKFITRTNPSDTFSNITIVTRDEKGPLASQSNHLANMNIFYKNISRHWQVNFSLNYTGKRIDLVSPWYGLDYWQRGYLSFNFSTEKSIGKHFKLSAHVINLFNNGFIDDILTANPNPVGNNELPGQLQRNKITVEKQNLPSSIFIGMHYVLN